jgi:hypothetical protein
VEVVGTPTESIFTGEKVAYEVTYAENDKVEKVVTLIRENEATKPQQGQEGAGQPKDAKPEPKAQASEKEILKTSEKER